MFVLIWATLLFSVRSSSAYTGASEWGRTSCQSLSQKPTVMVPPLTEGQQTTLTCTAPGLCSGSDPKITWTWRGAGEKDPHITGNITANQGRTSTLTFNLSAEHHGTEVTCKVSFRGDMTTEETVTLNVTSNVVQHHGPSTFLPWTIAGVSLSVNVLCIICILFLWTNYENSQ
ncbi:sialic acid-binding Ig-like lectin 14 isoform X1 [Lates japonicus]|uniref:Sialic acid-binding Ig-like lectin 14 isoform X1 n=1 Tax=Lates japonicus TaxID=270547 RepID=A0AAD3NKA8_LATJO|nr:sialic acid-binding Ig-like lectin 14 isoform X1 [Lates japonicus]